MALRRLMGSRCELTSNRDHLLEKWPTAACEEKLVSTPKEHESEFPVKTEGKILLVYVVIVSAPRQWAESRHYPSFNRPFVLSQRLKSLMAFSAHSQLDYCHLLGYTISCKWPAFYGCYYSSPAVKRSSHTLVGPLVLSRNIPLALTPKLLQSTDICSWFHLPLSLSSLSPKFKGVQFPHLATRCPQVLPPALTHLFGSTLMPFCSHTCISLLSVIMSVLTTCSADSNLTRRRLVSLDTLGLSRPAARK